MNTLLIKSLLQKFDKSKICQVYDRWPLLAEQYFHMSYDKIDFQHIEHIIFTGMGGSGAIGDTLSAILSKTSLHLDVVKGFHLPKSANSNTLVVATSASGNTLETLTVLKNAKKNDCKIIAFSSGGKMEEYCMKSKLEYRKIPILNSPRASYPLFLYSILNVLQDILPVRNNDVIASIDQLEKTKEQISSSNLRNNPSIELAKWLSGMPLIYYPAGLEAAAIRFKNSLQENAKTHVIAEDVIEACHNGIMSWESISNARPVLIQGKDDYIKTKRLWKIVKEYFNKNGIPYKDVFSVNGNILSKIVNLVYMLDYSSIYCAVLSRKDPTPTHSIDFVKSRM
ncbi:MAG TPA: SIS domain-containing protein [Verrucomicrobiae bacterium]|nr:SIS domain-containing protein [Verrucomicrobiae bacterium]